MLKSILIYLSQAGWARRIITGWSLAWRSATRFVAGETLEEAVEVVKSLNEKGINVTLDHLGEHTNDAKKAVKSTEEILEILDAIDRENLSSGISIKLSQIGLDVNPNLCKENLSLILTRAKELGNFVRIDMEDSPWVQQTLDLFKEMREQGGFENVGIVIQSYLYRSEEDVKRLGEIAVPVRLCKGAYKEPPNIAFPKKRDVDRSFDKLTELLIDSAFSAGAPATQHNGKFPPIPAIATHDEKRVDHAKSYAQQIGLPKSALEFQMLHGIRRELQERLVREGYPVRVYVPFGTEWYPYFMRRLAERPANLWFFLSNFFRS